MPAPSLLPALIDGRYAVAYAEAEALSRSPTADTLLRGTGDQSRPFGYKVENGAAIIPIRGSLLTDGPFVGPIYNAYTTYEGLRAELKRAAADEKVSRIVLAINSPGGACIGIESASEALNRAKAKKPVLAVVEGLCCSAAYWLASQATKISATPLSIIGHVGVVVVHVDASGAMKQAGLDVSLLYAGELKVEGNPYEALSPRARRMIQDELEMLRHAFANAVGRGRGSKFGAQRALDSEAATYLAEDAVHEGLIDDVAFLDDVLAVGTLAKPAPTKIKRTHTKGSPPKGMSEAEWENLLARNALRRAYSPL